MSAYPTASYRFDPPVFFENKTCEVWCHATIEGIERSMWLPVMDNKNLSVINPTSRDISDCRMRCLTKCLAMFGLGHYIYAGEDLPSGEVKQADISDNDKQWLKAIKADPGVLNQITDLDYKSHIQSLMGKQ